MSQGLTRAPQWSNNGDPVAVAAGGTLTLAPIDSVTVLRVLVNNAGAFKISLPETDSAGNPIQDCTVVILIVQNATVLNAITDLIGNILFMLAGVSTGAGFTMTFVRNAKMSKWVRQGQT